MDTIYAKGLNIKSRQFTVQGESREVLKVSIKVEDFKAFLDEHVNENGWLNLDIQERKEVSDKGATHYAKLDNWKPDGAKGQTRSQTKAAPTQKAKAAPAPTSYPADDDDIPF